MAILGSRSLVLVGRLLAIALVVMGGASLGLAEEPLPSEHQVKAAFLINFPKYADWPAGAFAGPDSPVVIAVRGDTEVSDEVAKAIEGRTVNGRRIVLRRLGSGEAVGDCHILFVSAPELRRWPGLLADVRPGILTVGESDDFLASGGIINLALRDRQVALEVNLGAAESARIKISSKLLSVALVVTGKGK